MNGIPRPEHPQPQLQRKNWENLNGEWEFAFDFGKSGMNRRFWEREHLDPLFRKHPCAQNNLHDISMPTLPAKLSAFLHFHGLYASFGDFYPTSLRNSDFLFYHHYTFLQLLFSASL